MSRVKNWTKYPTYQQNEGKVKVAWEERPEEKKGVNFMQSLHKVEEEKPEKKYTDLNDFSRQWHGKNVIIKLLDGSTVIGLFKGYSRYELMIEHDKEELIIFKQGIQSIIKEKEI